MNLPKNEMKKQKDILVLCQFYYPEYVSSATLPYEMSVDLVKEGFSLDVLCGYPKEYSEQQKIPKKEIINGISIKRIRYLQMNRKGKIGRLVNYFSFICSVGVHLFSHRKYKSIIVYSNPPILPMIAVIANKLFKTKIIYVCYDIYPELALLLGGVQSGSMIEKVMNRINHSLFNRVSKVVALSHEMKGYLLANKPELTSDQVEVIPNWYEESKDTKEIYNAQFKNLRKSYRTIVVYAGNMGICQDMETIFGAIEKLKEHQDILFCFAGHGAKQNALKERAKIKSLKQAIFFDFLTGIDFIDLLKIADCYLVSLEKGVEGLSVPSKTYSYLAMGRPVIAIMNQETDIARDLKRTRSGFSIEQGEKEALIQYILALDSDKQKVKEMGENSRQLFLEKYTREICTNQYIEMMQNVLNRRSDSHV